MTEALDVGIAKQLQTFGPCAFGSRVRASVADLPSGRSRASYDALLVTKGEDFHPLSVVRDRRRALGAFRQLHSAGVAHLLRRYRDDISNSRCRLRQPSRHRSSPV